MKILVAGASGATGRLLVKDLLQRGHDVTAIIRTPEKFPDYSSLPGNLFIVKAEVLDLTDSEMAEHARDCIAVASCLGHNISFRGLFGHPRLLVTGAIRRFSGAVRSNAPGKPVKFLLMNTVANRNRDQHEKVSPVERFIMCMLYIFLPPHRDNVRAGEFLRNNIGQNDPVIQWAAIRPDTLIDEDTVTEYEVFPKVQKSPLFDSRETSRINVAHFMADLISDDTLWENWNGKMPVIYNRGK